MKEEQGDGDRDWPDSQERVIDWEIGLPGSEELIPLNQSLISPDLASAFGISIEPSLRMLDVRHASRDTVSSLNRLAPTNDPTEEEDEEEEEEANPFALQQTDSSHEGRTVKRPRLVWTPQLHKRFVEVVAHLGEEKAVPKKIMHMMNVEGLTRENVASHLQKYRIYLKRMQGIKEGRSSPTSNHCFGPVPEAKCMRELPPPVQFPTPPMIHLHVFGLPHHQGYSDAVGMMGNNHPFVHPWSR